jgi:hypothetical protein
VNRERYNPVTFVDVTELGTEGADDVLIEEAGFRP